MCATAMKSETLADLLDRLGGVSPQRVRLHPPQGTATVRDVVRIQDHEDRLFELVEGVLVEKVMGYPESSLAFRLGYVLQLFLAENDLGNLAGP